MPSNALASSCVTLALGGAAIAIAMPALAAALTPMDVLAPVMPPVRSAPVPDALRPTGAKRASAVLPERELGPLQVRLKAGSQQSMTTREVREQVVVPLLEALGVDAPLRDLGSRPDEWAGDPRTQPLVSALQPLLEERSRDAPDRRRVEAIEAALAGQAGDGPLARQAMESARRLRQALEDDTIAYRFVQRIAGVPVEGATVVATRHAGSGVHLVEGRLLWHAVASGTAPLPETAVAAQRRLLAQLRHRDASLDVVGTPLLLAVPDGTVAGEAGLPRVQLRYAWRMDLRSGRAAKEPTWRAWVSPQGQLLRLKPLQSDVDAVPASGGLWRRDPGTGQVVTRPFEVDGGGGAYQLKREGFANRINFSGPGAAASQVEVALGTAQPPRADFTQPPIDDLSKALCGRAQDTNKAFEQVQVFALMYRHWSAVRAAQQLPKFPRSDDWSVWVEDPHCASSSIIELGVCEGHSQPDCPDHSSGGVDPNDKLNYAHDATIVGHEVGHRAVRDFAFAPPDWCGNNCAMSANGWDRLHDLADAWAAHFEDTPCIGGWVAKNLGGVDASRYCTGSRGFSPSSQLPRLLEVTVPLQSAHPGAHFPEHRAIASGDYADGQIAGAALWQVRRGLLGLDPAAGSTLYLLQWLRALKAAAWVGPDLGNADREVYELLYRLQTALLEQWVRPQAAGPLDASANKVLAGFAKAGLFAIPSGCLAGDATGPACAQLDGADAVIDLEAPSPDGDLTADGRLRDDLDFLARGGPPPLFHVWTGPRYRFAGTDGKQAVVDDVAPCNERFMVQVSDDPGFGEAPAAAGASVSVISSGWLAVQTRTRTSGVPNPQPQCYGAWAPTPAQWAQWPLQADRLYYRVTSSDSQGARQRVSTAPMNGFWTVEPPYAVINACGRAEPCE